MMVDGKVKYMPKTCVEVVPKSENSDEVCSGDADFKRFLDRILTRPDGTRIPHVIFYGTPDGYHDFKGLLPAGVTRERKLSIV